MSRKELILKDVTESLNRRGYSVENTITNEEGVILVSRHSKTGEVNIVDIPSGAFKDE